MPDSREEVMKALAEALVRVRPWVMSYIDPHKPAEGPLEDLDAALARYKALPSVGSGNWRFGGKVPLNVYEGDCPMFQCHTPEDAARVVALLNAVPLPDPPGVGLASSANALASGKELPSDTSPFQGGRD